MLERFPHAVAVSASTGEGLGSLISELGSQVRPEREFIELSVPHEESAVIARVHEVGQVVERNYKGATTRIKARIPPHFHAEFARYIVQELQTAGA
jgi:GTP-binding protein HflX